MNNEAINNACMALRKGIPDDQPIIGVIKDGVVSIYGEPFDLRYGYYESLLKRRIAGAKALLTIGKYDNIVLIEG